MKIKMTAVFEDGSSSVRYTSNHYTIEQQADEWMGQMPTIATITTETVLCESELITL